MADRDQAAVYAAELAAFDGTDLEDVREFDVIARLMSEVVDSREWWPAGAVSVRRARTDSQSSSTRCATAGGPEDSANIRLATSQTTVATAAHELAHALAGAVHGHDAVFRRAYLDVVMVITNVDSTDRRHDLHHRQLAEAFAAAGLGIGHRIWPAPPPAVGSAFAL